MAIAPYFGVVPSPVEASTYTAMTLDDFFNYVRTNVLPSSSGYAQAYHAVADSYGVHLISYEGGQGMVGHWGAKGNTALNALFDAFNREPRIKQIYLDYLTG